MTLHLGTSCHYSQITGDKWVHRPVQATVQNRYRLLVLTTEFDFRHGWGLRQNRCPTRSRRKNRPRRRLWAEQLAQAEKSLAGQPARQGRDLVGPPRAEIVAVCCEAEAAFLQRQHRIPQNITRGWQCGIICDPIRLVPRVSQ